MKNILFLVVLLFSAVGQNIAQEVSNKNWTLLHERTADWCPFCGTWGWDMKTRIFDKFKDQNVIFMAVHHSGGLANSTATEFGSNFTGQGQPIFYEDGVDINVTSNSISQKLDETQWVVDFKNSQETIAGVGINANLSEVNKTLQVDAKVEFFSAVPDGDYYLGLYLVEDLLHAQASRSGQQLHKQVLRRSLLNNTFGSPLKKGAVTKGSIFNVSATVEGITSSRENYKVIGIIWNKTPSKYLFFNANMVNVGIPASSEELKFSEINAFQSERGSIVVDLTGLQQLNDGLITLTDVTGKTLLSQEFKNNITSRTIYLEGNFNKGIHIITVIQGKDKISKKILLQ
jgi:hypothetical protein